jgi:hypothetical protein
MSAFKRTRVAVNGYGVIDKRVADAVAQQDDMELAGVGGYQRRLAGAHGDAEGLPPLWGRRQALQAWPSGASLSRARRLYRSPHGTFGQPTCEGDAA